MENSDNLLTEELKEILAKTIRKENGKIKRDDYNNEELMNKFLSEYKKNPRTDFRLAGIICHYVVIVLFGFSIFILFTSIIFNLLIEFTISDFNIQDLALVILFLLLAIFFSFVPLKKPFNEFNRWTFYLILLSLIGGAVMYTLIPGVSSSSILTYYLMFFLPLFVTYHTQKRMFGVGKLHLHGIAILVDIEHPQLWSYFISKDIQRFIMGWDEWFSDALGLRIKNYDEILEKLYHNIIYNPLDLSTKFKECLNQDFFNSLLNWRERKVIQETSNIIKEIIDIKRVQFELDNNIVGLQRKFNTFDMIKIVLGLIIGPAGLILSLLKLLLIL